MKKGSCFISRGFGLWFAPAMLCLVSASAFAQGGPPMLTDDPATPDANTWEINFAYAEQRNHQERLRSAPYVDFNYGFGDHVQLKYETRWLLSSSDDGGGTKSGLDNSLFGVKWRFLDEDSSGLDMSMYPQLELENFTGSVSRGIAEPGPNLFLPVEFGHTFGNIKLIGEAGYQYFHAGGNEWIFGLLAAMQASEKLELLAELRTFSEHFLNNADVIANVGFRHTLSDSLKLVGSVGTGLNNTTDSTTFIAYLGVQLILGKKAN